MKLILCILLLSAALGRAVSNDRQDARSRYDAAYAAWEAAAYGEAAPRETARLFEALNTEWSKIAGSSDGAMALLQGQAAIFTGSQLLRDSNTDGAAALLKRAGEIVQKHGVNLTRGRGRSQFAQVAGLHARIMASVGKDPLAGVDMGYDLAHEGAGYVALREGKDTEQSAFMAPVDDALLAPDEREGTMLRMDAEGRILQELPVALAVGEDSLRSRLKAVFEPQTAEGEGQSPGRFVRRNAAAFFSAGNHAGEVPSSKPAVPPPTPTPPNEEALSAKAPAGQASDPGHGKASPPVWAVLAGVITLAAAAVWFVKFKAR